VYDASCRLFHAIRSSPDGSFAARSLDERGCNRYQRIRRGGFQHQKHIGAHCSGRSGGTFSVGWNKPTRHETETILRRIPGLDWATLADLFRPEGEFTGHVNPDAFVMIADPDDRKFAALATAAKTPLVTNDNHILAQQRAIDIEILTRAPS